MKLLLETDTDSGREVEELTPERMAELGITWEPPFGLAPSATLNAECFVGINGNTVSGDPVRAMKEDNGHPVPAATGDVPMPPPVTAVAPTYEWTSTSGITINKLPGRCGGKACFRGTRLYVSLFEGMRRRDVPRIWMLENWPYITSDHLSAAFEYADKHRKEIDDELAESCPRCSNTRKDPEHEGACGECGAKTEPPPAEGKPINEQAVLWRAAAEAWRAAAHVCCTIRDNETMRAAEAAESRALESLDERTVAELLPKVRPWAFVSERLKLFRGTDIDALGVKVDAVIEWLEQQEKR